MDIIMKNKMLVWALILLSVTNIVAISAFWIFVSKDTTPDNKPKQKKEASTETNVKEFLVNELNLTKQQQKSLDSIYDNFIKESEKTRNDIRKYHEYINKYILERADFNNSDTKFDSLGLKKGELDKLTFYFFKNLYNLCDNEQKEKYHQLFKEMNKMISPGGKDKKNDKKSRD